MRSLRIVLPFHAEIDLTPRRGLLSCAAIAAVLLLSAYVQLLHESVARGAQWRADRPVAATTRSEMPSAPKFTPTRLLAEARSEAAR